MSIEQNKAIVREYIETSQGWKELNRQIQTAADPTAFIEKVSREVMAKYFTPKCIFHWSPLGDMSYDDYLKGQIDLLTNSGDVSYTLEDIIGEDDRVMVRYTARSVAKGSIMGIPAAGKRMQVSGWMLCKLAAGKIVEAWGISDLLSMMQQIGALPPIAQS